MGHYKFKLIKYSITLNKLDSTKNPIKFNKFVHVIN